MGEKDIKTLKPSTFKYVWMKLCIVTNIFKVLATSILIFITTD